MEQCNESSAAHSSWEAHYRLSLIFEAIDKMEMTDKLSAAKANTCPCLCHFVS